MAHEIKTLEGINSKDTKQCIHLDYHEFFISISSTRDEIWVFKKLGFVVMDTFACTTDGIFAAIHYINILKRKEELGY